MLGYTICAGRYLPTYLDEIDIRSQFPSIQGYCSLKLTNAYSDFKDYAVEITC